MALFFAFIVLISIVDFFIKLWVRINIPENTFFTTFLPFLNITYVKNRGAALSLFWGGRYFLIAASFLAIVLILYLVFIKKIQNKFFLLSASFIMGGGIGNLIDRIFLGYVVDYLKLSFFGPICNLSDYFITFGTVIFAFYFLKKKDQLLQFVF